MMSKLIVLVCLLAVSWAQSPSPTVVGSDDTVTSTTLVSPPQPTTTPTPQPTTTPTPQPTTTPTPQPTTTPTTPHNPDLSYRYYAEQATQERQRHFYCLNQMTTSFPAEKENADRNTDYIYWSILLQYPVLSYLDVRRKENLLNIIVSLAKSGAAATTSSLESLNESNLCIGPVDQYRVSYYEESVLIRIYFNGSIVVTPQMPTSGVSIADFNKYFVMGFNDAAASTSDTRVQSFLGRNAIAIDSTMPVGGFIDENSHPGGQGLMPYEDPTLRAVVIGTFVGNVTIDWATASVNMTQQFANNPRPINYSLEPGDIIFAIFGSLFLAILGGLIILGFCIHPFFLA